MTDFGPLLANPRTLRRWGRRRSSGSSPPCQQSADAELLPPGIISFTLPQAAAIRHHRQPPGDGPTTIYLSGKLAPELLEAIAVAAYSYMALVPLIQPPRS
ncbi:sodium ion-translocating decarboxylase subunit beta [Klebsiella pneumoniae]|nr:sodium ion-translocating decarboxylase subunit beta [Klebsiella pneumoniae]